MVGTLARTKQMYALVRTPEKDIYQVKPGNYLGQNYGVVTDITDSEIKLKELVQDGGGDWTERTSALQLQQPDQETTREQTMSATFRSTRLRRRAQQCEGASPPG